MTTSRATLWSNRHKHWLRQLERTGAPSFRFERPDGPRLRALPDWSRPLPAVSISSERNLPAAR